MSDDEFKRSLVALCININFQGRSSFIEFGQRGAILLAVTLKRNITRDQNLWPVVLFFLTRPITLWQQVFGSWLVCLGPGALLQVGEQANITGRGSKQRTDWGHGAMKLIQAEYELKGGAWGAVLSLVAWVLPLLRFPKLWKIGRQWLRSCLAMKNKGLDILNNPMLVRWTAPGVRFSFCMCNVWDCVCAASW